MSKIVPYIWCDTDAMDAAQLYTSIFQNSHIDYFSQYIEGDSWPDSLPAGTPLNVRFTLCGQEFGTVNGGPIFRPNPTLSFWVDCESAEELEALWHALLRGGTVLMELDETPFSPRYGWLQDRFGVSWQLALSGSPQAITPMLLFTQRAAGRAEEAVRAYCDLLPNSHVDDIRWHDGSGEEAKGSVKLASFTLCGQSFRAQDSAFPQGFDFTEGVSLLVYCEDQDEIDRYWDALTAGGQEQPCGWLKDRFGLSWQIVPFDLETLMDTRDHARADRMNRALLKMKKIDLATLRRTYEEH